jgi:hypothetical protein
MAIMAAQAAEASPTVVEIGMSTMTVCRRGETSEAAHEAAKASRTAVITGAPSGRDEEMMATLMAA